uniref:Ovule protein n=1 Tax=Romanomermis culicivorax TaxID=13658 RepID=A0A915KC05_ROMCU
MNKMRVYFLMLIYNKINKIQVKNKRKEKVVRRGTAQRRFLVWIEQPAPRGKDQQENKFGWWNMCIRFLWVFSNSSTLLPTPSITR